MPKTVAECEASGQHDAVRTNPELWNEAVSVIGQQDDGRGGAFSLGNCRDCGSTLAYVAKE
jgi:hypothetical protein